MASYTHNATAVPSGIAWYNLTLQTVVGLPSSTLLVLANSDGTETRIIGTGFTFGVSGPTGGTVTEIDRTSSGGGTVYETVTGISDVGLVALTNAIAAGNQAAFALVFNAVDTFNGFSGDDFFVGGPGGDTFDGGTGTDTVSYDNAPSAIRADLSNSATNTGSDAVGDTYSSIENLIGSHFDDILVGNAQANVLTGGAGNDAYFVDEAGDVVVENANEGTDTVYSTANFRLSANVESLVLQGSADLQGFGNSVTNVIYGNSGNNLLDGDAGGDAMFGGAGSDSYYVDNAGDLVIENAGEGFDTVYSTAHLRLGANVETLVLQGIADLQGYGNSLSNSIYGNAGNNILDGDAGGDSMYGGAGDDTYFVDNAGDVLVENANEGFDTVFSTASLMLTANVETLVLQGSADSQGYGNSLSNSIYGNSGNNILDGGTGGDAMYGGAGNDIYYVDNAGDVVIETAGAGTDAVFSTVSYTLTPDVETLVLQGSADLQGYGNALNNGLHGNTGNNVLDGRAGADSMYGGTGNDTYFVDNVGDVVVENAGEGTDAIFSTVNVSALAANVETLVLQGAANLNGTGNALDNKLFGNSGNNTLDGGGGADSMRGGLGHDTYFVDDIGDAVLENAGEGIDAVLATISYTLPANVESLALQGASNLSGTGNGLANSIFGNSGDNVLDGQGGADGLIGNDGNDTFVFNTGQADGDTIGDFAGNGNLAGDSLQFVGFGTTAQGATFTQIGMTNQWQIHSGLDAHNEIIIFSNGASIDPTDVLFS